MHVRIIYMLTCICRVIENVLFCIHSHCDSVVPTLPFYLPRNHFPQVHDQHLDRLTPGRISTFNYKCMYTRTNIYASNVKKCSMLLFLFFLLLSLIFHSYRAGFYQLLFEHTKYLNLRNSILYFLYLIIVFF